MNAFVQLSPEERMPYYSQASVKLNLPVAAVEKDFWVCWTLARLFQLPDWGKHLTFKGGTSLSKVWRLIERFSEDVDLTISRQWLGFEGESDPESASTPSQKEARIKRLKKRAHEKVRDELVPQFQALVAKEIPGGDPACVMIDEKDKDNNTVAFNYPSQIAKDSLGALLPYVKIEMGPRGDDWPAHSHCIKPYLEEALPAALSTGEGIAVSVLDAERTFLEKAMLLHEDTFRPPNRPRKPRMARHYYDLYCMIRAGVGGRAITDPQLFERVREHRRFYYTVSWVNYETMTPGSIQLTPKSADVADWRQDYEQMQEVFFFGKAPGFDELMGCVQEFQETWNSQ